MNKIEEENMPARRKDVLFLIIPMVIFVILIVILNTIQYCKITESQYEIKAKLQSIEMLVEP
jgi:cell division septal protein FtsQ